MFPDRLVDGYNAFLAKRFPHERARFQKLAESGQDPRIMIIGCIDSRVSPEEIFDALPGEILVVRNVANIVPRFAPEAAAHNSTSAALEFAVEALAVEHIVVMGHAQCGGIKAFAEASEPLSKWDFVGHWMAQVGPAADRLSGEGVARGADWLTRLEQASITASLANLTTFPWVTERVREGRLSLHGAYFSIADGQLLVRDPVTGTFAPLADGAVPRTALLHCR